MKSLSTILFSLLLSLGVLTGCYKDKGNYQYKPINDIVATTSTDTFSITQLDTLRIYPKLAGPDTNRLSFEWKVYPVTDPANTLDMGKIVTISRSRYLNEPITLRSGSNYYNLDFVVKDTVTGVSYFKHLYLQVTTAFQNGWMLLEQKGGHADISLIRPDYTVFHDVYSAGNPSTPLPSSARQLISINTMSMLGTLNLVYFDGGGYTLDNTSLQVLADYTKLFYAPPAVVQPYNMVKPSFYAYGPYTFNGGKIYALNGLFAGKLFGTAFTQPDQLGYNAAPFVASGGGFGGIFFDQANYRFMYDGGQTSTSLSLFPANGNMAFNMNNVRKKMLTMKAGLGADFLPNNWYAVFKNEMNDSCFLYTINANGNLDTRPVAEAQQAILNSPDVGRSPDYLFSNTIRQMYYAAGNKLYVYDMAANKSRVVYQFTDGENVTALRMMDGVITLATYNGQSAGGKVYYLPISSTGDISGNTYSKKIEGFEKITDLVYKVG